MSFNIADYIDVKERVKLFIAAYPEGSLQFEFMGQCEHDPQFIWGIAKAFRNPSDTAPAVGTAQELAQGKTNFTRGSEIQNLETSCWGRAISALGIGIDKGIASRQEVEYAQARQADIEHPPAMVRPYKQTFKPASEKQLDLIQKLIPEDAPVVTEYAMAKAGQREGEPMSITVASKLITLLKSDLEKFELIRIAHEWKAGNTASNALSVGEGLGDYDPWALPTPPQGEEF